MAIIIPWKRSEMVTLRREINDLCDLFFRDLGERFARSRLWKDWRLVESEDGYLLTIQLLGVEPRSIEASVLGKTLTITARRTDEGGRPGRMERFSGDITLPLEVDVDRVEALYRDGILSIRLPKKKPSTVSIPVNRS